jgi:ABC-type branched-subunit amino acid transport system ATPase component
MYRNELLVSQASGKVIAKESELNTYKPEDVFKEAVKRTFAQVAQTHFNKM